MNVCQQQVNLTAYNTFGISVTANQFCTISNHEELIELAQNDSIWNQEKLILGGGSNMLLLRDFDGLVLYMNTKGIRVVLETDEELIVEVMAGEVWHEFVLFCIKNNWGGVENLSLIPGSVGASPIQNIGAYGVELTDVFHSLIAFDIQEKQFVTFNHEQCEFGYRNSVFKTKYKNRYIITSVRFRLQKKPELNLEYGAIKQHLLQKQITNPTIQDVSDVVCEIRRSKLPDVKKLGNSGSFFKNPILSSNRFREIQQQYPQMPFYELSEEEVKVPAGWLIEQCGLKGVVVGHTGTYEKQALIIVNHGGATGDEIWNFAQSIIQRVEEKFGILLQPEVNVIG